VLRLELRDLATRMTCGSSPSHLAMKFVEPAVMAEHEDVDIGDGAEGLVSPATFDWSGKMVGLSAFTIR
jgi:hypothetical protein